jgi:hypothetical protein
MVDMDEWRSIDYKERLEKELKALEKSNISENNKKLILRYKNWRIADGVSFARVHRELVSLRVLCERFGVELGEIDEEKLIEILADRGCWWKVSTKNELRVFLSSS